MRCSEAFLRPLDLRDTADPFTTHYRKRDKIKELYMIPRAWESTPLNVMQAPSTTTWEYSNPKGTNKINRPQTLHLLICPTKCISKPDLHTLLMKHAPFCSSADSWAYPLHIKQVEVPMQAPTSPEQAEMWSRDYWPTFYRKTNPFGAHPGTIWKAEDELQNQPQPGNVDVKEAIALAKTAGHEAQIRGYGNGPGCVVMERVDDKTEIVAVAGDARSKPVKAGKYTYQLAQGFSETTLAVITSCGAPKSLRSF